MELIRKVIDLNSNDRELVTKLIDSNNQYKTVVDKVLSSTDIMLNFINKILEADNEQTNFLLKIAELSNRECELVRKFVCLCSGEKHFISKFIEWYFEDEGHDFHCPDPAKINVNPVNGPIMCNRMSNTRNCSNKGGGFKNIVSSFISDEGISTKGISTHTSKEGGESNNPCSENDSSIHKAETSMELRNTEKCVHLAESHRSVHNISAEQKSQPSQANSFMEQNVANGECFTGKDTNIMSSRTEQKNQSSQIVLSAEHRNIDETESINERDINSNNVRTEQITQPAQTTLLLHRTNDSVEHKNIEKCDYVIVNRNNTPNICAGQVCQSSQCDLLVDNVKSSMKQRIIDESEHYSEKDANNWNIGAEEKAQLSQAVSSVDKISNPLKETNIGKMENYNSISNISVEEENQSSQPISSVEARSSMEYRNNEETEYVTEKDTNSMNVRTEYITQPAQTSPLFCKTNDSVEHNIEKCGYLTVNSNNTHNICVGQVCQSLQCDLTVDIAKSSMKHRTIDESEHYCEKNASNWNIGVEEKAQLSQAVSTVDKINNPLKETNIGRMENYNSISNISVEEKNQSSQPISSVDETSNSMEYRNNEETEYVTEKDANSMNVRMEQITQPAQTTLLLHRTNDSVEHKNIEKCDYLSINCNNTPNICVDQVCQSSQCDLTVDIAKSSMEHRTIDESEHHYCEKNASNWNIGAEEKAQLSQAVSTVDKIINPLKETNIGKMENYNSISNISVEEENQSSQPIFSVGEASNSMEYKNNAETKYVTEDTNSMNVRTEQITQPAQTSPLFCKTNDSVEHNIEKCDYLTVNSNNTPNICAGQVCQSSQCDHLVDNVKSSMEHRIIDESEHYSEKDANNWNIGAEEKAQLSQAVSSVDKISNPLKETNIGRMENYNSISNISVEEENQSSQPISSVEASSSMEYRNNEETEYVTEKDTNSMNVRTEHITQPAQTSPLFCKTNDSVEHNIEKCVYLTVNSNNTPNICVGQVCQSLQCDLTVDIAKSSMKHRTIDESEHYCEKNASNWNIEAEEKAQLSQAVSTVDKINNPLKETNIGKMENYNSISNISVEEENQLSQPIFSVGEASSSMEYKNNEETKYVTEIDTNSMNVRSEQETEMLQATISIEKAKSSTSQRNVTYDEYFTGKDITEQKTRASETLVTVHKIGSLRRLSQKYSSTGDEQEFQPSPPVLSVEELGSSTEQRNVTERNNSPTELKVEQKTQPSQVVSVGKADSSVECRNFANVEKHCSSMEQNSSIEQNSQPLQTVLSVGKTDSSIEYRNSKRNECVTEKDTNVMVIREGKKRGKESSQSVFSVDEASIYKKCSNDENVKKYSRTLEHGFEQERELPKQNVDKELLEKSLPVNVNKESFSMIITDKSHPSLLSIGIPCKNIVDNDCCHQRKGIKKTKNNNCFSTKESNETMSFKERKLDNSCVMESEHANTKSLLGNNISILSAVRSENKSDCVVKQKKHKMYGKDIDLKRSAPLTRLRMSQISKTQNISQEMEGSVVNSSVIQKKEEGNECMTASVVATNDTSAALSKNVQEVIEENTDADIEIKKLTMYEKEFVQHARRIFFTATSMSKYLRAGEKLKVTPILIRKAIRFSNEASSTYSSLEKYLRKLKKCGLNYKVKKLSVCANRMLQHLVQLKYNISVEQEGEETNVKLLIMDITKLMEVTRESVSLSFDKNRNRVNRKAENENEYKNLLAEQDIPLSLRKPKRICVIKQPPIYNGNIAISERLTSPDDNPVLPKCAVKLMDMKYELKGKTTVNLNDLKTNNEVATNENVIIIETENISDNGGYFMGFSDSLPDMKRKSTMETNTRCDVKKQKLMTADNSISKVSMSYESLNSEIDIPSDNAVIKYSTSGDIPMDHDEVIYSIDENKFEKQMATCVDVNIVQYSDVSQVHIKEEVTNQETNEDISSDVNQIPSGSNEEKLMGWESAVAVKDEVTIDENPVFKVEFDQEPIMCSESTGNNFQDFAEPSMTFECSESEPHLTQDSVPHAQFQQSLQFPESAEGNTSWSHNIETVQETGEQCVKQTKHSDETYTHAGSESVHVTDLHLNYSRPSISMEVVREINIEKNEPLLGFAGEVVTVMVKAVSNYVAPSPHEEADDTEWERYTAKIDHTYSILSHNSDAKKIKNNPFVCWICRQTVKVCIQKHMKEHFDYNVYECQLCREEIRSFAEWKAHRGECNVMVQIINENITASSQQF